MLSMSLDKVYKPKRGHKHQKLLLEKGDHLEEIQVLLERHDQHIKSMERQMEDLKEVYSEVKSISSTLVMLTTELKHINSQLSFQQRKIEEFEKQPHDRLNQITTAIIAALTGCIVSIVAGLLMQ